MSDFHHAYLLTGDADAAKAKAFKMAAEILAVDEKIVPAHPDVKICESSLFPVEDARQIRDAASRKSVFGRGRVFMVLADFFTPEAANALLKTIEEPAGLSYFFIITASPENILPTLRSRLVEMKFGRPRKLPKAKEELIKKFLASGPVKRLETVKKIAEEKEKAADLLDGLEAVLSAEKKSRESVFCLEEIERSRGLLFRKGSMPKMILEHLALVLVKI
jgi:DNA polymerase III delta prime subunit